METDTKDPQVIAWFDDFHGPNDWAFLSNFYVGEPLESGPYTYQTGEHMFQAYKSTSAAQHRRIAAAPDPHEAKRLGKTGALRRDWELIKYDVMRLVLLTKFTQNRAEGGLLLATGNALLVEGTYWGDRVWGVDLKEGQERKHRAPGRNWLGHLLMARRAELLAEVEYQVATDPGEMTAFARYGPARR
ncbi:MAG: NADAR family protein [Rhizobacter sp.]